MSNLPGAGSARSISRWRRSRRASVFANIVSFERFPGIIAAGIIAALEEGSETMIPYRGSFATAVPQSPEVRHEILKAERTFADQNDQIRRRHQEITSIRNELEAIQNDITEICRNGRLLALLELRKYGYNPAEPRIPKHQTGGGEWTRDPSAGQRYAAATQIAIHPSSLTGISRIDDTTKETRPSACSGSR